MIDIEKNTEERLKEIRKLDKFRKIERAIATYEEIVKLSLNEWFLQGEKH
jgi:hypothetical protein